MGVLESELFTVPSDINPMVNFMSTDPELNVNELVLETTDPEH